MFLLLCSLVANRGWPKFLSKCGLQSACKIAEDVQHQGKVRRGYKHCKGGVKY